MHVLARAVPPPLKRGAFSATGVCASMLVSFNVTAASRVVSSSGKVSRSRHSARPSAGRMAVATRTATCIRSIADSGAGAFGGSVNTALVGCSQWLLV